MFNRKRKKSFRNSLKYKKDRLGWIFVSPLILGIVLVYSEIIISSFIFSISSISMIPGGGGYSLKSMGFENYRQVLMVNPTYNRTIIESIQNMLISIPVVVFFSLFIAIILNSKMKFRAFYRMIFFIPVILATGIIERIDMNNIILNIMSEGRGIETGAAQATIGGGLFRAFDIQMYLMNMRFSAGLTNYVVSAVSNLLNVVNASGVQILVFLGGLQAIPDSIYEAAYIEGATAWECFWKITFVLISPMIFINTIYTVVDSFTSYKNPLIQLIYDKGFLQANYGEASAMAWIYFVVVLIFIGLVFLISSKMVFYQQK